MEGEMMEKNISPSISPDVNLLYRDLREVAQSSNLWATHAIRVLACDHWNHHSINVVPVVPYSLSTPPIVSLWDTVPLVPIGGVDSE
jgi:hypothetical protein